MELLFRGKYMTFTHNHLTKIYWLFILGFGLVAFSSTRETIGLICIAVIYLALVAIALRSMSHQVIVSGRKLTSKNLFGERSILILPESRIYIRKNIQSYNFVIRHYDYSIKIVNPRETIKINANVNHADDLYQFIAEIEQRVILPLWLERFSENHFLKMDDSLTVMKKGIKYKDKTYLYENLAGMELEQGYFRLLVNGKLWQTAALALPVSDIPNLMTFMALINQGN